MEDGEVRLRVAGPADAESLARTHVETWRQAYRGLLPDELLDGLSAERRAQQWRQWLTEVAEGDVVLAELAELADPVIGFVWVAAARDEDAGDATGELMALYVRAEHWGSGAGRALHAQGIDQLRARGFGRATLWVLEGNSRARRFYERQGWEPDGNTRVEEVGTAELHEVRYARPL